MPPFFRLPVLVLATTALLATSCSSREEAPQPSPIASLNTHTVAVRYQAKPVGTAAQELPKTLNLLVAYERVGQTGPTGYRLLAPVVQFHDPTIGTTTQEVPLSLITTYPNAIRPNITVTMWEDQALPTAARASYEVTCELVLDGKVTGRTTYSVTAGQLPPLVASSQTEVAP